MPLSLHPLIKEFPDYQEAIERLRAENGHFEALLEKYDELDKEIYRIEDGKDVVDDLELDRLKMERVKLKDELFEMLRNAA